jgi:hypothetical protein
MYPVNLINNCQVYDSSLFDDIKPYKISETFDATALTSTVSCVYTTGIFNSSAPSASNIVLKADRLKSFIDSSQPTNTIPTSGIWLPAIIKDESLIDNKEILSARFIGNKVFGIEEMIKIEKPQLKNWTFETGANDCSFTTDWIINYNLSPLEIEYGVLFWYRLNSPDLNSSASLPINKIVNGHSAFPISALTYRYRDVSHSLTTSDIIVKINEKTLLDIKTKNPIDLNSIPNADSLRFRPVANINFLDPSVKDYSIWISNGEFYSYYLNPKDKYDIKTFRSRKSVSRSYVSPCLYHFYRSIYHSLTLRDVKKLGAGTYSSTNEKLKKLSYLLATAPQFDRVSVDYLSSTAVYDIVKTYIESPGENTTDLEITALIDVVARIMNQYKNISETGYTQTLSDNYIHNKTDLIKKLQSKYGVSLKIPATSKIQFSKTLDQGAQGYFRIDIKSYGNKNTPGGSSNPGFFNNFTAEIGNIKLSTDIGGWKSSDYKSNFSFTNKDNNWTEVLPLADLLHNQRKTTAVLNLGKDIVFKREFLPDRIYAFEYKMPEQTGEKDPYGGWDKGATIPSDMIFSWSLVDGPQNCLRFDGYDTYGTRAEPTIYIRQTGLYTIECSKNVDGVQKKTDRIKIYAVDNNNSYGGGVAPTTLLENDYNPGLVYKHSICPNIRQFAVNKRGLVWLIDTDMYLFDNNKKTPEQCLDKKIPTALFREPSDEWTKGELSRLNRPNGDFPSLNTSGVLKFEFTPNNTIIKIDKISIEKMRDENQDNCQCKSFYEDKLIGSTFNSSAFGALRSFYRKERFPDAVSYKYYRWDAAENSVVIGSIAGGAYKTFEFPTVSNIYGPDVRSYGGYSYDVVKNLGIEMPFHPVVYNGTTTPISVSKIPAGTLWGGITPTGQLKAVSPANLTKLTERNDMGGSIPGYRCFLRDIPITGVLSAKKGYFHPNSGWMSYDTTSYNSRGQAAYSSIDSSRGANITSVKRFKQRRYKTYNFRGYGIFDIRPSNTTDMSSVSVYNSAIDLMEAESFDYAGQNVSYGIRNVNGIANNSSAGYYQQDTDDFVVGNGFADGDSRSSFTGQDSPPRVIYSFIPGIIDSLTLKDLEIKLNFLNYPNPKNLIVALEVKASGLSGILNSNIGVSGEKLFVNNKEASQLTSLPLSGQQYISNIKNMNTNQQADTATIYLLNQEHINNYGYNFSFKFSDNASIDVTLSDVNKTSSMNSGFLPTYFNNPLTNNQSIQPTISATGFSDMDSFEYKNIIKNNISLVEASFAKLKGIPLRDARFNLKIMVVGPEEIGKPLDNVTSNNELAGLNTFNVKSTSNSIFNSLCSWELILHTEKTNKFNPKSPLGYINYDKDNVVFSGYNYLLDMTDKKYLIPKVNLNAPYQYIPNINKCKYTGSKRLSIPQNYWRPQFPSTITSFVPFFTLAGAMDTIWAIQNAGSSGGWGDPFIFGLFAKRYIANREEEAGLYFHPVYSRRGHGQPFKAIVLASKDKVFWYQIEASFFKYQNTPILSDNKFKYFKLHSSLIKPLSQFGYSSVKSIADLVDKNGISYTFSKRGINRSGLSVSLSDTEIVQLKDNGLVLVEGQDNSSDNGLYIAKSGAWIRFTLTNHSKFLSISRLSKFNTLIDESNITLEKVILVTGIRAYHFFDIDDNIDVSSSNDFSIPANISTNTVKDKALIYLNGKRYTVLCLNSKPANPEGFLAKREADADVLVLYKDHAAVADNSSVGKWGLTKTVNESKLIIDVDNSHSAAVAEGSVGYGTEELEPSVFSRISDEDNIIHQTYDIFDNNKNNKFKFNNIYVTQYDENRSSTQLSFDNNDTKKQLLSGYPYGSDDFDYVFDPANYSIINPENDPSVSNVLDELKKILRNNTLQKNTSDYYFLDLKSEKFKTQITCNSGEIVLENDFIRKEPIAKLANADKTTITNRLNLLNTATPNLNLSTATLNNVNSIPDVTAYYNNLSIDNSGCFDPSLRATNCPKSLAKAKLSSLYAEKNELLLALDIDKQMPSGVLPYKEANVSINPTTNRVSVSYKDKDYYWIDIDKNQDCDIAYEALPKVLKEVTQACFVPILPAWKPDSCASVCGQPAPGVTTVVTNGDFDYGRLDAYSSSNDIYVYKNKNVDREKALYPQVTEWMDETDHLFTGFFPETKRKFFLSCNDTKGEETEDRVKDVSVTSIERYYYPKISNRPIGGLVKDVLNLDNTSEVYIKFKNVPRKLKTIDVFYTPYLHNEDGDIEPTLKFGGNGLMNNGFTAWNCIKVRGDNNLSDPSLDGKTIETPDFYKMQNEMIFRAFFGSTDGIEHKNTNVMTSKEMWEWIPYEYYTGPALYFRGGNNSFSSESVFTTLEAPAEPTYNWTDLRNWYSDPEFNIPATALPNQDNRITITTKVTGGGGNKIRSLVVNSNAEFEVDVTVEDSVEFNGSSKNMGSITVDGVSGKVTFNEKSENYGKITVTGSKKQGGVVIFNGSSINRNSIDAGGLESSITFHDQSNNSYKISSAKALFDGMAVNAFGGEIRGNAVFSDQAINYGDALGDTVFNDNTTNQGKIFGRAIFNDQTENKKEIVARLPPYDEQDPDSIYSTIFKGDSKNTGTIKSNSNTVFSVKFSDNSTNDQNIDGSIVYFFDSAINNFSSSISCGKFAGNSINKGKIQKLNDSSIFSSFSENSINNGQIDTTSIYFSGESINRSNVYCSEWIIFNGSSINKGVIKSKQINFRDESKNQTIIDGEMVEFDNKSVCDGLAPQGASIKSKYIRFIGESSNKGILNVEMTVDNITDPTDTNFLLTGLWFFHSSYNEGTLINAIRAIPKFKDKSSNKGTIVGDARFYEEATNPGTVDGVIYEDRLTKFR